MIAKAVANSVFFSAIASSISGESKFWSSKADFFPMLASVGALTPPTVVLEAGDIVKALVCTAKAVETAKASAVFLKSMIVMNAKQVKKL